MIADPAQAEDILASGKADMVAMARAFLDNPRWVWHAPSASDVPLDYPPQYARSRHDAWPGAKLARPGSPIATALREADDSRCHSYGAAGRD